MTAEPGTDASPLDFRELWSRAIPWDRYLVPDMKQHGLWDGVFSRVRLPDWALEQGAALGPFRLLVLAEDWCGDAANIVPVVAAWARGLPDVELRVLPRDTYPDVMDRYLTAGTRSIPIVIGLDRDFRELGHWGPRPAELQAWVRANLETMPKAERYAETRRWHAADRGETTLRELLAALGPAAGGS